MSDGAPEERPGPGPLTTTLQIGRDAEGPRVRTSSGRHLAGRIAGWILRILVVLIVRRFPITREQHEARLALLDDAARLDPDATGQHP